MMVGFEPTPEDWCLKPAPRVARRLRPLGHIINVRDSDRVRTRIDLGQRIDPATLTGVDFKSTALTTRPHYLATKSRYRGETDAGVEPATFR